MATSLTKAILWTRTETCSAATTASHSIQSASARGLGLCSGRPMYVSAIDPSAIP